LNKLRDKAYANARKHGFHEEPVNLGEQLMLIVSELSEALECGRNNKWALGKYKTTFNKELYETYIRGTVEEKIADAIIRLFDLAGIYNIDLDRHVEMKMTYNETRPYKHGKRY
jgi:NTP pyrophosphatase (non-canonical NTP hydrolase)